MSEGDGIHIGGEVQFDNKKLYAKMALSIVF